MDREYIEDYNAKEIEDYEKLKKNIAEGKFDIGKDKFPSENRFLNLQEPVAYAASVEAVKANNLWGQVPFCGSLIVDITPIPEPMFEEYYFKVSEIPKIIEFVKDTGKLQFVLSSYPYSYQGLDYLEPIFKELNPPYFGGLPNEALGGAKEIKNAIESFWALAKIEYLHSLNKLRLLEGASFQSFTSVIQKSLDEYVRLKLSHYAIAEEIGNLMIDDPFKAFMILNMFRIFVTGPTDNLISTINNSTLEDVQTMKSILPLAYHVEKMQFPCEIGKFLFRKLTKAPIGLRACYDIMDHYEDYDLQSVQKSLNEGIIANHPDIVEKSVKDFDEILENVWNDLTVRKTIKNLKRGLYISIAAVGTGVSVFTGELGFLVGLGFSVGSAFLKADIDAISEKLGKFLSRSYQANIYDFKKKSRR